MFIINKILVPIKFTSVRNNENIIGPTILIQVIVICQRDQEMNKSKKIDGRAFHSIF